MDYHWMRCPALHYRSSCPRECAQLSAVPLRVLSEEDLVDHSKKTKHESDPKLCRKYKDIMLVSGIYFLIASIVFIIGV